MLKDLGIKYVVAKAQNDVHAKVLYKIGADRVVFPERDMGERVAHNLVATNIMEFIELSPEFSIIEFVVPRNWVVKNLREINLRVKYGVNVVALKSTNSNMMNAAPMADSEIKEDTILVVIGSNENLKKLEKKADL
jgi:trk system potassium uptake protein TrkA